MCLSYFFKKRLIVLFTYLWLHWVFRAFLELRSSGCLLQWLVLLLSAASRHAGFSSCGAWAPWLQLTGSRALAQYLRFMGLVAPQRVRSSQTRDQPGLIPDQHLARQYALRRQGDSSPLDRQGSPVCVSLIRILVITRRAHPDSEISASSAAAAAAKSRQSCLTVCNPIDGSPPGSPVPGIFQARTLEWVAISFSNA